MCVLDDYTVKLERNGSYAWALNETLSAIDRGAALPYLCRECSGNEATSIFKDSIDGERKVQITNRVPLQLAISSRDNLKPLKNFQFGPVNSIVLSVTKIAAKCKIPWRNITQIMLYSQVIESAAVLFKRIYYIC